MEAQVRRIKNILRSEFFTVNDAWLAECIEYYVIEHNSPPDNEVYEFVKSQWLLSDLRKINSENGCLPSNLTEKLSTSLPGTYILQMNKMYDIATSKYKQIQDIRSVSNANVEATEEQNEPGWIPKKRRMLQMHLTDGVQDIIAIEYRPMPSLNSMLLPGYKVMIVGPVNCRRGVILLENKNFKDVGGEEESLLICNAVENVLARSLGMEENPDPYNDNKETKKRQNENTVANQNAIDEEFNIDMANMIVKPDTVNITQNEWTRSRAEINQSSSSAPPNTQFGGNKSRKQATRNTFDYSIHDDDVIELNDSDEFNMPTISTGSTSNYAKNEQSSNNSSSYNALSNKLTQEKNKGKINSTTIVPDVRFTEDDFDFSDFDVVSTNVTNENTNKSAGQKRSNTTSSYYSVTSNEIQQSNSSASCSAAKSPFGNDDFPDDDFDFDDFDVVPAHTSKSARHSPVTSKGTITPKKTVDSIIIGHTSDVHAQTKPNSCNNGWNQPCPIALSKLSICNNPGAKPLVSGIAPKPSEPKVITSTEQHNFPCDDFDFEDFDMMPREVESETKSSGTSSKKLEESPANNSVVIRKPTMNSGESPRNNSPLNRRPTASKTNYTTVESSESLVSPVRTNLPKKGRVLLHGNVSDIVDTFPVSTGGKRTAISPPTVSPQKVRCLQETPKQMRTKPSDGKNMKISDFLKKISPISVPPKICDFLCDFVDEAVTDIVFRTVRAQVSAMGKLSKKDASWLLDGTITDGTACLEVTFATELLEKLLGFTTTEFSQKKKLKRTNPDIDQELRAIFRNAEHTLKNLDALVELQLRPNEKARALSIRELTVKQKEAIDKRLKMLRM